MDRGKFFAALRRRGTAVFGTTLSQAQVQGCEAILDACARYSVVKVHHVAEVLGETYHETGSYMLPIKETVMPSHKDKNPADDIVIRRLDAALSKGKLPWVRTPYWRKDKGGKAWFGRGPIQTTHRINYARIGQVLGVDLLSDPDCILDPTVGAASAVVGLRDGLYTGHKLSDYRFPAALDAEPDLHPRRMVNGKDGTDADVARYHRAFHAALLAAGYDENAPPVAVAPLPAPAPTEPAKPQPPAEAKPVVIDRKGGTADWLTGLINALLSLLKGNKA